MNYIFFFALLIILFALLKPPKQLYWCREGCGHYINETCRDCVGGDKYEDVMDGQEMD